jgi:hypothetical protein
MISEAVMASVVGDNLQERRLYQRRATDRVAAPAAPAAPPWRDADGLRVSWGGIWGGVLTGMGFLILLAALGVAVGITAVRPGETEAQTLGTGAAIWAGISLLIALFVGGMVSTRIGMVYDRATGMFSGALVWVLSLLLMAYLATSGISMVAGGAFKLIGGATQAFSSVMGGAASSGNVDPGQAASQAERGVQDAIERARSKAGELASAAERAKPEATATAWITFGAMVLSLLAAVLGAMSGRRRAAVRVGREA